MNARKRVLAFAISAGLAVSLIAIEPPAFAQAGGGAGGASSGGGAASAPGSSGSVGSGAPGSSVGMPGPVEGSGSNPGGGSNMGTHGHGYVGWTGGESRSS
jgi:hypothetical protein